MCDKTTKTETNGGGEPTDVVSKDLFSIVDEVEKEFGKYPEPSFDVAEMANRVIERGLEHKAKLILEKKSRITPTGEIVDESHPNGMDYTHR